MSIKKVLPEFFIYTNIHVVFSLILMLWGHLSISNFSPFFTSSAQNTYLKHFGRNLTAKREDTSVLGLKHHLDSLNPPWGAVWGKKQERPFPRHASVLSFAFPSREALTKFLRGLSPYWQLGLIKQLQQRNYFLEHTWKFHSNNTGSTSVEETSILKTEVSEGICQNLVVIDFKFS